MTISELIEELEKIKHSRGDIEVIAPDNNGSPGEAFVLLEKIVTPLGPKQVARITS